MSVKLFDSELKIMEVLWKEGNLSAGQIAKILKDGIGWNRNTTYTVIKKCIEKEAIERKEPNFICCARITRKEVQNYEAEELIDKMFEGSRSNFFAALLDGKKLSKQEMKDLRNLVEKME